MELNAIYIGGMETPLTTKNYNFNNYNDFFFV